MSNAPQLYALYQQLLEQSQLMLRLTGRDYGMI